MSYLLVRSLVRSFARSFARTTHSLDPEVMIWCLISGKAVLNHITLLLMEAGREVFVPTIAIHFISYVQGKSTQTQFFTHSSKTRKIAPPQSKLISYSCLHDAQLSQRLNRINAIFLSYFLFFLIF